MLILAFDTATRFGSVALAQDRNLLGVIASSRSEHFSSRLFKMVQHLLNELNTRIEKVDLFAVCHGPGSFTGLRVGLTAAKAWAEVYGRPIAPVSSLEALAAQAPRTARVLVPVFDAHRGQVFAGCYARRGAGFERLADDCVMPLEEFLAQLEAMKLSGPLEFVTPAPGLVEKSLAASPLRGARVTLATPALAPWIALCAAGLGQSGRLADSLTLDANYVRRSDAELLWKEPAS
jgi:tRNA threonylcarbamoyladenosine biosynthesis protein TsaB